MNNDQQFDNYNGYPPPQPQKDNKGCRLALGIVGWLLSLAGVAIIVFSFIIFYAGESAQRDREKASKEYYEKYGDRLDAPVNDDSLAVEINDDSLAVVLGDSLATVAKDSLQTDDEIPPPPPIGFNIAGAFGVFFALIGLIPLIIGIVLIIIAHRMKRKSRFP